MPPLVILLAFLFAGKSVDHMKGVPGWSEKLASDSEAAIKAEACPDCTPEELQRVSAPVGDDAVGPSARLKFFWGFGCPLPWRAGPHIDCCAAFRDRRPSAFWR